jgi:catechol 2,3-dioxygenase
VAITQCAYAELNVDDLEGAIAFHKDVVGMFELGRENGTAVLGCGVDDRPDLVLTRGGTGVKRVALEVESEDDLDRYESKLSERGIAAERCSDPRVGIDKALRFGAPGGLELELVVTGAGPAYLNPGQSDRRGGIGPVDFDHITLKVPDAVAMVDFLTELLGFSVSDEMRPAPGVLAAAWTRAANQHHDIAMFKGPASQSLHHYALRLESFEHLKQAADRLAQAGVAVETGPGRHSVGGNVYLFFWAPGGNRCEFSAEMPRVGRGATRVWSELPKAFSAWGATPPATFAEGS